MTMETYINQLYRSSVKGLNNDSMEIPGSWRYGGTICLAIEIGAISPEFLAQKPRPYIWYLQFSFDPTMPYSTVHCTVAY